MVAFFQKKGPEWNGRPPTKKARRRLNLRSVGGRVGMDRTQCERNANAMLVIVHIHIHIKIKI